MSLRLIEVTKEDIVAAHGGDFNLFDKVEP